MSEICQSIDATLVCGEAERDFSGVYVGDLLSRAMSHVRADNIWITIMSNVNVVAVATLTEPAAIVLAENVSLQEDALASAIDNGVTVLRSPLSAYEICGILYRPTGET
ncbi:MAG: AraC family transcriptional regulator [Clostridia bacterium]|nr:AraC family transcriptional regulator [Clostridia bacterium]